jgi:putative membrane protein insertion efficiency factor
MTTLRVRQHPSTFAMSLLDRARTKQRLGVVSVVSHAVHSPAYAGIALVHLYRWTLGLMWAGSCKYHPTCSQYALDALRCYGLVRGSILAGWRLLRCNPWSHGGVDYVEDQRLFR